MSSEGLSSQSLGKYWQLNQNNQHTSTYSRIQQQRKNPYYATIHNEYARENPRINQQHRQKITFPGSTYPKEISQQCTPATHIEAVHCQRVLLGVFHPCLWPLKAPSWIHLVGGSPNLSSSARWRQYPSRTKELEDFSIDHLLLPQALSLQELDQFGWSVFNGRFSANRL